MEAWIGIGSNVGDSRTLCSEAIARLRNLFPVQFAVSSLYRTAPVGKGFDGDFINAVCRIYTDKEPYELLATLQMVEYGLGKEVKVRGRGNRMMDLDLLLYGDLILQEETLQIPHPGWWDRLFVLIPMHEVAPWLLWRGEQICLNKRIAELN